MNKRLVLVLFWVIIAISCISCSSVKNEDNHIEVIKEEAKQEEAKQEEVKQVEEVKKSYQIPDFYKKEKDNVVFNTEIIVNQNVREKGLYYTTATLQDINYDKAYDILFKEKTTAKKEEYDSEDGKYISYQSSNYESLNIGFDSLFYLLPEVIYYNHSFSEYDDNYNANLYTKELEFDFATKKEVWEQMKNTLNSIGLNIEGNYTCYSLDYETLQNEEYAMGIDGKKDLSAYKSSWSQDDNGYFFIAHQELQDCTVQYPIQDVFEKISEQNAPIKFLYTKNGIISISIEGLFNFNVTDNYIDLLAFEKVADIVSEKYGMILGSSYEVTRAELYFRPMKNNDGRYDVVPTWQFTIKDLIEGSEGETYINAINGEEIL